jgi:uncharacterized protein (TIGR03118 family)
MILWPRRRRQALPKPARNSGQHRRRRLVLECLEGRLLLSGGYAQVNLASDVPGLARITDSSLVNPWGITFSPTGPFWFADNGSGAAALLDGRGQPLSLLVNLASTGLADGTPTGTVFNGGPGFRVSENGVSAPSRFLFASEDGTISGWTAVLDWTHAIVAVDNSSSGAVYKGLALATDPAGNSLLYAADFGRGTIDVFDQNFQPVVRGGAFQDPNIPEGFAPFNIRLIDNLLFVTYAQHEEDGVDDLPGAGHGFIDVYDTDGNLVRRLASQGPLNSPWGLALAPAGFGPFGGDLLVGNNGDGHINAYDPQSGAFLGTLAKDDGSPLTIPNLWALTSGNGHLAGAADTLFFTAGVDNERHGLFGAIQAPQRKGADTAGPGPFDPHAPGEPGDYPLPPPSGPVILESTDGSAFASAVLLPLRDSSLALIPTLATAAPKGKADLPVVATPVELGLPQVSVVTASSVARSAVFASPNVNAPASPSTQNHFFALDTLLDILIAQQSPKYSAQGERLEVISDGGAARPLPSLVPSGKSDVPPTPVSSEGRPEAVVGRNRQNKAAQTAKRAIWKDLLGPALVLLSIPTMCILCKDPGADRLNSTLGGP